MYNQTFQNEGVVGGAQICQRELPGAQFGHSPSTPVTKCHFI